MSRIAAVTRIPSALSSGLSMISIGNSLPSLRRPMSSIPVPICCASASAAERSAVRDQPLREALRNDVLHLLPEEFVAAVSELLLRLHIQQHDLPGLVHHHHRIRSRLQQPAVPALPSAPDAFPHPYETLVVNCDFTGGVSGRISYSFAFGRMQSVFIRFVRRAAAATSHFQSVRQTVSRDISFVAPNVGDAASL